MSANEKSINIEKIYEGKVLNLELHTVELNNGNTAKREIVRHRGGVAVIAATPKDEIYLVRQFRKPYDKEIMEIPAGKLEKDELPEECAFRELQEETGLKAEKMTQLTIMYPSPGYTDEKIYIYKAEGLTEGEVNFDEDESISLERCSISKAVKMIKTGDINDAKSIIAILLLASQIKS